MFYNLHKKYIDFGIPMVFLGALLVSDFKFNLVISVVLLIMTIYYFFVFSKEDIFNPMGLFSAVWLGGIFLSSLQLTYDQYNWSPYVWLNMFLIYLSFFLTYVFVKKILNRKKIEIKVETERLYIIILVLLLISYGSFFTEAYNLGFIPLFSNEMSAYLDFHFLFLHYFTLIIALIPSLTIIYKALGGKRKIALINIMSVIMPIMLVSRQTILFQVILIIVAYHYCIKKIKFRYLVTMVVIGLLLFSLASNLRHQDTNYMYSVANFKNNEQTLLAQPYLYISMNFENLRNAIENSKELHYGVYTLSPYIELLNLGNLFKYNAPAFLTNQYFNTSTFALPFYLDFGLIGMVLGGIITALISSVSYFLFDKSKSINNIIYGVIVYCLVFTFFVNFFINLNIIFDIFILSGVFLFSIKNSTSLILKK